MIANAEPIPLNQPAGGVVGLFTCNSEDNMTAGFSGQTVVANDGGPDGVTTLGTLERAGFAFVGVLADTNDPQAAMTAAQKIMTKRKDMVVTEPEDTSQPIGNNRGDELHIHRPKPK